ncbi:MAG: hypothetical protein AB8G05_21110 [Oligoflexales bacterium]
MILKRTIHYAIKMKFSTVLFLNTLIASFFFSCTGQKDLPPIEEHVSSPIDIAVSDAEDDNMGYFFILNSDFNHVYETGSILIVSRDGNRKKSVPISRLGRSIKVAGNRLLLTFDENDGEGEQSKVELYEISYSSTGDFPELTHKKTWNFDSCRPLNSNLRKDYQFFAVACETGSILVGTFDSELSNSKLTEIRKFPTFVRRALHFDTDKNLLFAFMTDMNVPNYKDRYLKDSRTWNKESQEMEEGSNEVPDVFEDSLKVRKRLAQQGNAFHFVAIDLNKPENLEDGSPKFREINDIKDEELRWMYFTFNDKDGNPETPILSTGEDTSTHKYYRANFWEAIPDTNDSSSFYLSHRGNNSGDISPHSNNVVHVKLKADALTENQKTEDLFDFTRVFGLAEQKAGVEYTGNFAFTKVGGKDVLLVNNFRTRRDFNDIPHYSIKAIKSDDSDPADAPASYKFNQPYAVLESSKAADGSYYQFAVSDPGVDTDNNADVHVLVSSFFQDTVKLYKLTSDTGFEHIGDF